MTKTPAELPVPASGGSYVREKDGSLRQTEAPTRMPEIGEASPESEAPVIPAEPAPPEGEAPSGRRKAAPDPAPTPDR